MREVSLCASSMNTPYLDHVCSYTLAHTLLVDSTPVGPRLPSLTGKEAW